MLHGSKPRGFARARNRALRRLALPALLLTLPVAACDGDLNVGSSQLEADDVGTANDAGTSDPLDRVARGLVGEWSLRIDPDVIIQLKLESRNVPRSGSWAFSCAGKCSSELDAGRAPPALNPPGGEFWILEFAEDGPRFVDGVLFNTVGFAFKYDTREDTIQFLPGVPLWFLSLGAFTRNDAGPKLDASAP